MPAVVLWTGFDDADFSNAANWSGGVPTAGDELVFDSINLAGNAVATGLNNDLVGLSVFSIDFGNGSFTITGGNGLTVTNDITVSATGNDLIGIAIAGDAAVNMSGSGDFTLSGNNSFTGAVEVNSGSLVVGANNALGTTDAGTTVDSGASLLFSGVTYTTEEEITLDGGTIGSTTGTSSFAGAITMTTGTGIFDVDGTLLTLSGDITGDFSIDSNGTGILELSGDNSFLGDVNVNAGTLRVSSSTALGQITGATAVHTGATIDFANVAYGLLEDLYVNGGTIGASTGTSSFDGIVAMTVDDTAVNVASGAELTLNGVISGLFGLDVNGPGVVILTGANTYSGDVTVNAGTLRITAQSGLGTIFGDTTVNAGGTLDFANILYANLEDLILAGGTVSTSTGTSSFSGPISLTADSFIDVAGTQLTLDGVISGSFGFSKTGVGTVVLDAVNTYTGNTTVTAGVLRVTTDGALGTIGGNTTVLVGATLDFANVAYATAEPLVLIGGTVSGSTGTSSFAGGITLLLNSFVDVDGTSLDLDGAITGVVFGLEKSGAGWLILDGASTFTGDLSVLEGTLGGNGSLTANIELAAGTTLNPGLVAGTGILTTTGAANLAAGSTFVAAINTTTVGTGYDQLVANGVTITDVIASFSGGFLALDGTEFIIVSNTSMSATVGTFVGLVEGSQFRIGAEVYQISYVGGDGNDVTLTVVPGGTDTVGVFNPNTATWYLRDSNNNGGSPDYVFKFGGVGWIGVTGDWDGDGVDTIGVYNPNTGAWYLRNENNNNGAPDYVFQYGGGSFIPVVGDWDGDGVDTIGVYSPNTATWYLRNTNSAGSPDETFSFGFGSNPVVGDWDGVIGDGIGVYNPTNGMWYLRNTPSAGSPDLMFAYGFSNSTPVVGDWDFNGTDGVGVYANNTATWYLRNTASSGSPDAGIFTYGGVGMKPVTGNWTADAALMSAGVAKGAGSVVTEDSLAPIFAEALSRWGVTGDASFISLTIGDLPANTLAQAVGTSIVIDRDAAGHGWFIDSTPEDDSEFANGSRPAGMDLLTTVMHELGHVFGIEHSDEGDADLMARTLRSGVRQEPSAAEVDAFLSSDAFDLLFV